MKVLLDTHVWLFRLLEPERLSTRLEEVLGQNEHELHLSPISTWETLVLVRKGRLEVEGEAAAWVEHALAVSETRMAPITHKIAMTSEALPGFPSQDPADRFLAATAIVEGMALATLDRAMLEYEGLQTVD